MDIEALRTFKVLSETKNYTHAANQLFVAQSTVTNRINELEKELNVTLLTRTNRSVKLTPEGEQFLMYAEKVIELTSSSLSEFFSSLSLNIVPSSCNILFSPKSLYKISLEISLYIMNQLLLHLHLSHLRFLMY